MHNKKEYNSVKNVHAFFGLERKEMKARVVQSHMVRGLGKDGGGVGDPIPTGPQN